MPRTFFLLLGSIFLLFPISHLRLVPSWPVYLSEIPLMMATLWFVWNLQSRRMQFSLLRHEVWVCIGTGLFLGGAFLSYGFNPHTETGLGMLKSFFVLPILLMLLLSLTVSRQQAGEIVLWLWFAGLAATAWVSLTIASFGWWTYDGRLSGLYTSPNYLAMLLGPGVILALYFLAVAERKSVQFGSVFFLLLIVTALFLTCSYGAWVSIFVALGVFLCINHYHIPIWWQKSWPLIVVIVIGLSIVLIQTDKFQTLIHLGERSSLSSRMMIWHSAVKVLSDHIWLGIGPGRFQAMYLEYQKFFPPYLEWAVPEPHNLYLALWLATGLIGLGGWLLILWGIGQGWIQIWKKNNQSLQERWYGASLLSLLSFYLVYGLIDTPYFKNDLAFAWWGVVGLIVAWTDARTNTEVTN